MQGREKEGSGASDIGDILDGIIAGHIGPSVAAAEAAYIPGQHWIEPRVRNRVWTAMAMSGRIGTPFRWQVFAEALVDFPFAQLREYVIAGIRFGFDTGTTVAEAAVRTPNLRSAGLNPAAVSEWLETEVQRGHMAVSDTPPHPFFRTCGIGLVPKPTVDGVEKFRFISDFSRADGQAVNEGIDREQFRLSMLSVWDVIDIMSEYGEDAVFSCIDCEWGYRQLDANPSVYHTQGYEWLGKFYTDFRIVFGCTSSAAIYNAVMECVEWIVQQRVDAAVGTNMAAVRHYLDDFIMIGRDRAICAIATQIMLETFAELGVPLNSLKSQLNVTRAKYLGIMVDAATAEVEMAPEKVKDLIKTLVALAASPKASMPRRDLESIIGKLTWGHNQWFLARPLINPMLHALAKQRHVHGKVKLSPGLRRNARDWIAAIETARPRPFHQRPRTLHTREVTAVQCWEGASKFVFCGDASAEHGYGWFSSIAVATQRWSSSERASAAACQGDDTSGDGEPVKNSSTLQELRCLASAVRYWLTTRPAPGATCTYLTDADNLVHLWRKGRSRLRGINSELLALGRALQENANAVRVVWHSREETLAKAADALSRGDIPSFKVLLPRHPAVGLSIGVSNEEQTVV